MKAWGIFLALLFSGTVFAEIPTGRYKVILEQLQQIQAANPDISEIFSIGTNDEGTPIYGIRIGVNPGAPDPSKIGHLMVSTHHGNELKAPEFTMAFIRSLIAKYRGSELWRDGFADLEFSIIPVLNISGYNKAQRHEYGQDPNRDYSGPCNPENGGRLKSIRELQAFMQTRIFSGSVTVHGYDGSLTYPWGVHASNYQTKDNNLYRAIFEKAATLNGYRTGTASDIVYPANGCYEDHAYWKYGMWSLLLELRDGSASDIATTVEAIHKFYELLDASPSVNNQFESKCRAGLLPDLRFE